MIFQTKIEDIDCLCRVESYSPGAGLRTTGTGFGDAEPPEDEEFHFLMMTLNGEPQQMLQDMVTPSGETQLIAEYKQHRAEASL